MWYVLACQFEGSGIVESIAETNGEVRQRFAKKCGIGTLDVTYENGLAGAQLDNGRPKKAQQVQC